MLWFWKKYLLTQLTIIKVLILPSLIPSLMHLQLSCRSKFLTNIIILMSEEPLTFLVRQVYWEKFPHLLLEKSFLYYFWKRVLQDTEFLDWWVFFFFSLNSLNVYSPACMVSGENLCMTLISPINKVLFWLLSRLYLWHL